ncbi:AraC family transcriptional regulator [Paenimyroides tangerinum]|uniref:AraC family transcriptional regulator n=1 Tax=Paenimyroides tangerinum TaxID=2488728 RepID=A0A3P3W263_9FLAO|nr:AraC family transcriptional regulator [Paenimyroides tangerinum]RRJ89172.1 AraC family transcriptional regulator [Paenimyroides tangerinum]
MSPTHLKNHISILLLTIFLLPFSCFSQKTSDSYENLWKVIENDTTTKPTKLLYLDTYITKAQKQNNTFEHYKGLNKKSFLVSYTESLILLEEMQPLLSKIKNDSLTGDFLNSKVVLFYKNRAFNQALKCAIASENFNEQHKNFYSLNFVRIDIGNIYYHTRHYQKAVSYFNQAKNYYKNFNDYNHSRAYLSTLYSLGKTFTQLQNTDSLKSTIVQIEENIHLLNAKHKETESGYLNYLKGCLAFLENNTADAATYFKNALPIVTANEDFTNQHVIYLYLGKIAWLNNDKATAVTYFSKIDALFKEKQFLNYELREAYDYLISYYKETNQTQLQLQATENLIALNKQFEAEQLNLANTLHTELETKKLERERSILNISNKQYGFGLVVLGILILLLLVYVIWQDKEKKKLKIKFTALIEKVKTDKIVLEKARIEEKQKLENEEFISVFNENRKTELQTELEIAKTYSLTEKKLLRQLELFENQKQFLKLLKLDELAQDFGTNRSTLSALLNKEKGNFNIYLNELRINEVLKDLTENSELRKLSIQEIAENYGFSNPKSFTQQFKVQTGLTPSYFIEQLELTELDYKFR